MLLKTDIPNKPKLWQKVCYQVQEENENLGFLLQDKAYLDSLERGMAIVGVKSHPILEMLERKKAVPLLEKILSEMTGKPIQVLLAHGRPRIFEPKPKVQTVQQTGTKAIAWKDAELGALHAQYGDIMGIVDNHPVFVQACKPLPEGGWGIFNRELTNACKDYGAHVVLKGLRDVANRPDVDKPRGYFFKNLKAGVYGHKLAVPASPIGPVGE